MSKHFHSLKEGDELEIKGPLPKPKYEANKFKRIGMVAGGTGQLSAAQQQQQQQQSGSRGCAALHVLTRLKLWTSHRFSSLGISPMLQVVDAIIANPNDKTEVSLSAAKRKSKLATSGE